MKIIFKKIGLRLRKVYHVCFRRRHVYKNGWYALETPDGWALYRKNGSLVADKLMGCHVCGTGWFKLKTTEGYALYRADETLVADKLKWCYVYDNGDYEIETEKDSALYRSDGTLIEKKLLVLNKSL